MKNVYYLCLFIAIYVIACTPVSKEAYDYVDPFIGTGFHGHTYPGATVPFGSVQLSPDTRIRDWDACSGYHYSDSTILGFSHTHLSGTGCIDLGDILFHPTTKEINLTKSGYIFKPLAFSHTQEKASPGYYSVYFEEDGIKAELTATEYTGVHRYTFGKGKKQTIIIDMAHVLGEDIIDSVSIRQTGKNEIAGMRRTQGWVTNQYIYFVARFSKDFSSVEFVNDGVISDSDLVSLNKQAVLGFGISDNTPIVAEVALSIVSEHNARKNLEYYSESFNFDQVHLSARSNWEKLLSLITVEGGESSDLKNFYTALYHTMVVPNIVSDVNGQYRRHNGKTGQLTEGQKVYSTFSIWDTFRAWNPLFTLLDQGLVNDMINSYLKIYDDTGELPIWPLSSGETGTMIGYHSASVIADAYMKGIRGYDVEKAYNALKISSDINKKGSDYYIKYGFIPSDLKRESISCLLEFAYDDWCIAQLASDLGKEDDCREYTKRAISYINVFDGYTKFFRGKSQDGNWDTPFNPFEPGRAYTEATAWQYRFFVPHDVNGLIQLFGGQEKFIEQLDSLFIAESKIDGEMSDITGLIGQYAQGNEPSHHMAYLYNYVGQPWKTQALTRHILHEMYQPTPEGISGNEDCGQMSAWYILTSLGIYPVCPGSNEFSLTTPLFEKAVMKLTNGKILTITANNPANNIYIDKIVFNQKEVSANYITYEELMEGGELQFVLTDIPNTTRGVKETSFPYSLTTDQVVSIPYTTKDFNQFKEVIEIDLNSATGDARIFYTVDGSEPDENSIPYTVPIKLTASTQLKAKAFKTDFTASKILRIQATKATYFPAVQAQGKEQGVNYHYYEGYFTSTDQIEQSTVMASGTLSVPTIDVAQQSDHFAFAFYGVILIPEDDVYEFMTKSDDGSVLFIDGKKVVDNDGSHAEIIATGRIALKKGFHTYKLLYFEDYEGEALSWGWKKKTDSQFEPIPQTMLYIK